MAAAAAAGDSLICQAIINSGIALGTEEAVVEETSETAEVINEEDSECPDEDENITEVHVKEEILELETPKEVGEKSEINCYMEHHCHFILPFLVYTF